MIRRGLLLCLQFALMVPMDVATAQESNEAALLLIMDSSGSMNADDGSGQTKLQAAKDVLRTLVDELPDGAPVGLRVYGHRVRAS